MESESISFSSILSEIKQREALVLGMDESGGGWGGL